MSKSIIVLHKHAENLLNTIYPTLRNYPRREIHGLCNDIKSHCIALISSFSLAEQVRARRLQHLQEAQAYFNNVKILMQLSYSQKYISEGFHDNLTILMSKLQQLLTETILKTVAVRTPKKKNGKKSD